MKRMIISCAAMLCLAGSGTLALADGNNWSWDRVDWMTGTWYLALDSEPFGLPPGFPLSGLAVFNRDGTLQILDAGDFGQATFTNTQNSVQFGAWRKVRKNQVIGTTLFLEADLATGEVLRWNKVRIVLARDVSSDVVAGTVNVSVLECSNLLPLPTALSCPDPTDPSNAFTDLPPADIPVTFTRLHASD
jgi:hypothetical protein